MLPDGFDWLIKSRSGVQPIFVEMESLDCVLTVKVLKALESATLRAQRPIKGLLFTNPQNPIGQCYPEEVIKGVINFCHERKIHFIADEIYALSAFSSSDIAEPVPFISTLQIDVEGMGCDLSRVHTIWSISKDLGSGGLRMVCSP